MYSPNQSHSGNNSKNVANFISKNPDGVSKFPNNFNNQASASNSNRSSCDDDILIGNLDDLNLNSKQNINIMNNNNSNNNGSIDSLLMHSPSPPHNLSSYAQHQNYSQQLLQLQQQQQQLHHYQQQQMPQLSNIAYRKVRPEPIK